MKCSKRNWIFLVPVAVQANAVDKSDNKATKKYCCDQKSSNRGRGVKWLAAGGMFASIGVCAACCLLPFALLSVGITGAWVSSLNAAEHYKTPLIALTVGLLGYGFYADYFKAARKRAVGVYCATCESSNRSVRLALWLGTVLAIGGIAFGYAEPYL